MQYPGKHEADTGSTQLSTAGTVSDREAGYAERWEWTHSNYLCIWERSLYIQVHTVELGSGRISSETIPGRPWYP